MGDERLKAAVLAIVDEIARQNDLPGISVGYTDMSDPEDAVIDMRIDLVALAKAVCKAVA